MSDAGAREERMSEHSAKTKKWSEDMGEEDLIVKVFGDHPGITPPSPFSSTCTSSAANTTGTATTTSSDDPELHLSLALAWNLDKKRRKWKPRRIQLQVWPILLHASQDTRSNLIAVAPTSSGKTLAYGIPMVCREVIRVQQRQKQSNPKKNIVGLVLVPTRELCLQIQTQLSTTAIAVTAIYGGVDDRDEQVASLKQKPTVVVATPGRFVDILQHQTSLKTLMETLQHVVLDEADRLATNKDMAQQVDQVFSLIGIHRYHKTGEQLQGPTRKHPIMALFSATAPHKAQQKWVEWVGPNHIHVCAKPKVKDTSGSLSMSPSAKATNANADFLSKIPEHLAQRIQVCTTEKKPTKLLETLGMIQKLDARQRSLVMVFFHEIKTLQRISQLLSRNLQASKGKKKSKSASSVAAEFHGKMSQKAREQTLQNFRSGKIPILLATDICARGIHVSNVWYVVNYDFPEEMEQYVHRCGRAARNATQKQISARPPATIFSFVTPEECQSQSTILSTTTKANNNNMHDSRKRQVLQNVLSLLRSTDAQTEDTNLQQLAK